MSESIRPSVVVMGVSAAGKSTVSRLLAERLGTDFLDADDLHPASNRAKMSAGTPLTDADRTPWLDRVSEEPPSLLRSQLDTLEALEPDEIGVTIDVAPAPEQIARAAVVWLEKPRA